jgi:hypothetical protein
MVVLQLIVNGKPEGHIPLALGTTVALHVAEVPDPVAPPVPGEPCPCNSGKALADCHGAEQAGSAGVEGV